MVSFRKYISIIGLLVLLVLGTQDELMAQKVDAFARVAVSPREGVVRQPYKVTITVYSSTWFAKPLQFANLQIDNAFIIPFTRTVSGINYINNKKYATLSFYYVVFPYNTGDLVIPSLQINAEIPPEGDFKGVPTLIRTKEQIVRIKPIPASKENDVWTVAENIRLSEKWSKALNNLKVGDVVERTITIDANGTLPTFIEPVEVANFNGASIYPKEPELQDKRDNNNVHGVRIEHYSYLFEKEGEINIPEQEVLWWNPKTKRVYKRTLAEKNVQVKANPDLEMMESLKDSLMALNAPQEMLEQEEDKPWMLYAVVGVLVLLLFIGGASGTQKWLNYYRKKRLAYKQSEDYFFKIALRALKRNSRSEFINALYQWFDRWRNAGSDAAIRDYLFGTDVHFFDTIFESEKELSSEQKKQLKQLLKKIRQANSESKPKNELPLNLT